MTARPHVVAAGELAIFGVTTRAFTLFAHDLTVSPLLADTGSFPVPGGPVTAGSSLAASGTLAGEQTLRFGPACHQGNYHAKLWYEGTLTFDATPATVPADSPVPVVVSTPFKLHGNLKGYAASNIAGGGGPDVISVTLAGAGQAFILLGAAMPVGSVTARFPLAWLYRFSA